MTDSSDRGSIPPPPTIQHARQFGFYTRTIYFDKITNGFYCCKEPDDMIRIMLATDNHIGYLERDPVRGQDSINTFREILQLAVKHDVSPWH
jgi:double-strand break repair protein MRE11